MDMKQILREFTHFSTKKHASPKLIYLLGLVGLLMILAAGRLYFSDATSARAADRARAEGETVIERVSRTVRSFKRAIKDEQVQLLAARAMESPELHGELLSQLQGRFPQIKAVTVYRVDQVGSLDPLASVLC